MSFLSFIWNPDSVLLRLGPVEIRYYSLSWMLAFILGWVLMRRIFLHEKKPLEKLDRLFFYTIVSIMLGARLGHVFFYDWGYYQNHLIEILLPIRESASGTLFGIINGYIFTGFSGLASHGAAIGAIVGVWLYRKREKEIRLHWLLDRLVIPCAIGGALIRLGNLFNSEINGKIVDKSYFLATQFLRDPDDMPVDKLMAMTDASTENAAYKALENNSTFVPILEAIPFRHPAQLYEAVGYLLIFVVLYLLYWKTVKRYRPGFLFGTFMVLVWSIRFGVEYFKKSQGGFETSLGLLSTGQWLSLPMIAIGLYFIYRSRNRVVL